MSSSACRELPGPRARSAWRAERLGGRPSPPPLATAPCWPMQRDTAGAAPASLRAAGRRPKRPLPSGDPTPRRSRARRECGARAISVPGHAGRSDMGSQAQNIVPNSESAAAAPPPAAAPLTETNSVPRSRRRRRRRLAPRLRHRRPPSRGGVPLMARAPRSPARLAAAPLSPPLRSWPPPPLSIPPSAPPLPPPRASPPPPPPSPSPLSGAWRASHRPGRGAHTACAHSLLLCTLTAPPAPPRMQLGAWVSGVSREVAHRADVF